jgi:hypothetical protein
MTLVLVANIHPVAEHRDARRSRERSEQCEKREVPADE